MGILQSIYNDRLGAHFASPREFATRASDTILLTPFAVERRLGLSHVRYFDRSRLPNQCFNSRKSVTWFSLGCSFFPGKGSVLHSRSKKGGVSWNQSICLIRAAQKQQSKTKNYIRNRRLNKKYRPSLPSLWQEVSTWRPCYSCYIPHRLLFPLECGVTKGKKVEKESCPIVLISRQRNI